MAFNFDAVLLTLHLLAAAAWFGAGWYDRLMISPALRDAGDGGTAVLRSMLARGGGARWFAPASMLTVITGGLLYWRFQIDPTTPSGGMVTAGAALGVLAVLLGIFVHAPAEAKVKAAAQRGDDEAMLAHAAKLEHHTTVAGVLVSLAFLLMALRHAV